MWPVEANADKKARELFNYIGWNFAEGTSNTYFTTGRHFKRRCSCRVFNSDESCYEAMHGVAVKTTLWVLELKLQLRKPTHNVQPISRNSQAGLFITW